MNSNNPQNHSLRGSIRCKSDQTALMTEKLAELDAIKRGWYVLDAPRDSIIDFCIDRGLGGDCGLRIIESVQVKNENNVDSQSRRQGHSVSAGGKQRESRSYYDEGIIWLAVVKQHEVLWYHREQFKYLTGKQILALQPEGLPEGYIPTNSHDPQWNMNDASPISKGINLYERNTT